MHVVIVIVIVILVALIVKNRLQYHHQHHYYYYHHYPVTIDGVPNWYRIMYHSQVVDWMVPRLPVLLLPCNIPNPMFDSTTMYVLYFDADDDL